MKRSLIGRLGVVQLLWSTLTLGCDQIASETGTARASLPAARAVAACGGKGQPDCPLQQWMKATLQTYQRERAFDRMASAFDQLAAKAPDGYAKWADVAEAGAKASRAHDEAGVRQACKTCHDDHRQRYRQERRGGRWQ